MISRLDKSRSYVQWVIPKGCICKGDGLMGMRCDAPTHAHPPVDMIDAPGLYRVAKAGACGDQVRITKLDAARGIARGHFVQFHMSQATLSWFLRDGRCTRIGRPAWQIVGKVAE